MTRTLDVVHLARPVVNP